MERRGFKPEGAVIQQLAQEITVQRKRFGDDIFKIREAVRASYLAKGKKFEQFNFDKAAKQCGVIEVSEKKPKK